MNKKDASLIVKIIAILGMIAAVIGVIGGILIAVMGPAATGFLANVAETAQYSGFIGGAMIAVGIIAIIFSAFMFFVCWNLMKFKEWARIVAIVIASLGVISGLMSLLSGGFVGVILHGVVLYFLAFNKDVRALFK